MNTEIASPFRKQSQDDAGAALALAYLMAREIHTYLDLDAVLHRVLTATASTMDTPVGSLYVFDDLGNVTHRLILKGWQVEDRDYIQDDVILEQGLTGWVMRHQRGAIVANTAQDKRWYSRDDESPRSAIAAPLQTRAGVIGVLTLAHEQPGYFSDQDLAMLTVIADQAATAVVNARLYQAEQRRRQLAATMAEVSQTISATIDLGRLFDVILEQLARVIHYDSASILLGQDEGLQVAAARGFEDAGRVLDLKFDHLEESLVFRTMRQRQAIVVDDVKQDPGWRVTDYTQHVRGRICAPLMTPDEVFGVLAVDSCKPRAYAEEDAQVVATFASQAAIALSNARLVEQLQAAEMRYARLFEDSTDMILIFDLEGRVLDANLKACQLLERDKESLVGFDVGGLESSLRTQFLDSLSGWRTGQEVVFEIELPVPSGRVIPVEFRTKRIDYDGADSIQWSGRDISARRELEQLRQDLTSMLVHDMRGPMGNLMNVIRTIPHVVGESTSDSPLAQLMDIAAHSGQQMHDLIDSMLDVSRLEQREVPLNRTRAPVEKLLRAVEDQFSTMAKSRQIELSIEVQGRLPVLWADQDMIRRVLANLVSNAIKYSPREERIEIVAGEHDGCVEFSVSDHGPGVPPQYQWRIFDKFARVQHEGAPKGVGLGLAFCRLAVEAHGGRIWVDSIPGRGSTFSFTLPLVEPIQNPYPFSLDGAEGDEEADKND